ncbi:hypothetical protein MATR_04650 [Marivirga tractuosa]|uniref:DUF1573 domain-containing protein n=1 Tax=Marivirga tractuosa (strain ATCC 23168 / DSM 4126 / NBRC 15989 / NCIMB 1408 / VKM B-1430 / H-43) TaxID=643867 RepID=E4TT72_MARTH|nr:DUF1573 domain-containing protein [Marivirga tractuosa]ADR21902.1 protein of unknown function DUF1573 [Marivirga tractuosa DSM 4126]BDD13640.1 hypothetical protein MATR_04650 [Marivirga tractuosa]
MKSVLYAFSAAALLTLASCSGDLEKRVTDLERRVAALEGNGGSTASKNTALESAIEAKPQAQNKTPNQKPEGPLPSMEFEEKTHDFGTITEGEVVTKVFKFKNTGEAPLIISNATSSCGCTVPSYPKDKPIAPGEEGEIEVKYNSRGKKNQDNKVVRITANTWPATNNITIKAFVEPKANASGSGPVKQ